ncbi:DUF6429 family protein [Bradyrhizobium algeriense]|uniref:DUF6429 family protein n=1 Tax=Bradyrhizobium algeriense TaxID=634784 RepID=UPI002FF2A0DF
MPSCLLAASRRAARGWHRHGACIHNSAQIRASQELANELLQLSEGRNDSETKLIAHKAKSVVFTDEGLRQSEALFRKLFAVGREV